MPFARLRLPELPTHCTVCEAADAHVVLPDRSAAFPPERYDVLCPLCLDQLLGLFPLMPRLLRAREVTGAWPRRR